MQSLGGRPIYSAFLFGDDYGIPHGPCSSDDELWAEMKKALEEVPGVARRRLQEQMPSAAPYTFTHGDLAIVNIMVENGRLTGIIDWEASGYFPVWWEYVWAGIGLSEENSEWKTLLQAYMPGHPGAMEFFLNLYALSTYSKTGDEMPPKMIERAKKLL